MIIGITGGTGCGKTTALKAVEALGGTVIDCDALYHRMLETDAGLRERICIAFPGALRQEALDRRALGEIVFDNPAALQKLNEITWNYVTAQVREILKTAGDLAAIDAIALFESGLNCLCDVTVAVTCPEQVRIARLTARDGIDQGYAARRIASQRPQEEFSRLCDYRLENDGSIQAFYEKSFQFFKKITEEAHHEH